MLDIKTIVEKKEEYIRSIKVRNLTLDISHIETLYEERNTLQKKLETLQKERNKTAKTLSVPLDEQERIVLVEKGKRLKKDITNIEEEYKQCNIELIQLAENIPNLFHPDIPIGKEEKDSLVIRKEGTIPHFDFKVRDHVQLGTKLDIIDFDTAAEVSGIKFYYLKNQAVLLELALLRFGIDILQKKGFSIFQTPDIAKLNVISKLGFQSRGHESNIYKLEDEETGLIGTAEITLGGYLMNSILQENQLPVKYAGISHCFRREAGAAGQYSKGLYRVHQFTKLEMFIFCHPQYSETMHHELLVIEEEIYKCLEIPYRIVDTCTGDLGKPAYRKFDIEAWMPGRGEQGEYGEITSVSNCTDYQAQRLNIRVDSQEKKKKYFPHMLNGTAIAISRVLVALLENNQQFDGSILIPKVLQSYCGFSNIPCIASKKKNN